MSQLQVSGPCAMSIIGPPTKTCMEWQPNVIAIPSYDPSRRLTFVGAADHFLHVVDADNGKHFSYIPTDGRVITETLFDRDRGKIYVGTDRGVMHSFDAFSFSPMFNFFADSSINNNFLMVDSAIVFTSALGTVYSVDAKSGELNWQLSQPLLSTRLRLSTNSTILSFYYRTKGLNENLLAVPHADGYITLVRAQSGDVKKKISLGSDRSNGFPDIVAPLVMFKNKLWVASYDMGLFSIDLSSQRVRDHIKITGIEQLSTDGHSLFAASGDTLFSISEQAEIVWKNKFEDIVSRSLRGEIVGASLGRVRMFFGSVSRLLHNDEALVLATSAGSVGVFDKKSGDFLSLAGNSVGISGISWADGSSFLGISKRGLLLKFQLNHGGIRLP